VYAPSAEAFRGGGSSTVAGGWSIDANVERWGKRERERNIYIVVNIYIYIYIYIYKEGERAGLFRHPAAAVRPDISAPPFAGTL